MRMYSLLTCIISVATFDPIKALLLSTYKPICIAGLLFDLILCCLSVLRVTGLLTLGLLKALIVLLR